MKRLFKRFSPITILALVITLIFISCSLEQLLSDDTKKSNPPVVYVPVPVTISPPKPLIDEEQLFGTWVTQEKDGIVKEVEIRKLLYSDNYVEKTYLNGNRVTNLDRGRRYNYIDRIYPMGKTWKYLSLLAFKESDDITFSIQNNELTLGGGDIRYKGNNNSLEGTWVYEIETYRIDITFKQLYEKENQGIMIFNLTLKPPNTGWLGHSYSYRIKDNNTLILESDSYFNGKRVEIIDGKLHMTNRFVQNEQIKEYNEAHNENPCRSEMFGLFFRWVDKNKNDLYNFFTEEYYKVN